MASTEQLKLVSSLLDHLDAMVAYWDRDQVCLYANDAFRHWFGKSGAEVMGMTLEALLGPLYERNLPFIRGAYAGHRQVFERECPTPEGIRHGLAMYTPHVVDGEVQGIFAHVVDVTPMKQLEGQLRAAKERAEYLATHDVLTGLPNRALLMDRMEQALARARRERSMLAVLSLDLDNFKRINDTYGHAEGDKVLVRTAGRLKRAMRESDSVTRMGGDEFILLAPGVETEEEVSSLVNRLHADFRTPFHLGSDDRALELSVGVALYPRDGSSPGELLAAADRSLYVAKHAKRSAADAPSSLPRATDHTPEPAAG